jgi:hypothetical protein
MKRVVPLRVGLTILLLLVTALASAQNPSPPSGLRFPPDPNDRRLLTVTVGGSGSGTVTGPGITCGSDCTENYIVNTTTTIVANPGAGSTFTGWSGACSGTGICTVLMNQAQSVAATFTSSGAGGSVLQQTADAMAPDTWAVLTPANPNGGAGNPCVGSAVLGSTTCIFLENTPRTGFITGDAFRGCWDVVRQEAHFLGKGHTDTAEPKRHVVYSAVDNLWRRRADAPWALAVVGGTDHAFTYGPICDSRGRRLYMGEYNTLTLHIYDLDTQTWLADRTVTPGLGLSYTLSLKGMEFAYDMGARGLLLYAGTEGGSTAVMVAYDPVQDAWQKVPVATNSFGDCASLSTWMSHSEIHGTTLFGCGGGSLTSYFRALTRAGRPSGASTPGTLDTTAPATVCTGAVNRGALHHNDPATGNMVQLCGGDDGSGSQPGLPPAWNIYNPITNAWTAKPAPGGITNHILNALPIADTHPWPLWGTIGIPILDQGVIMYLACNPSQCQFRLYKGGSFGPPERAFKQAAFSPGVLRSVGFDSANDIAGVRGGGTGTASNILHVPTASPQSGFPPVLDSSQKASGATALKFTLPGSSTEGFGDYTINFRDDMSMQTGIASEASATTTTDIYIQWRQRLDGFMVSHVFAGCKSSPYPPAGTCAPSDVYGTGWKQLSVSEGDRIGFAPPSCVPIDVPVQNLSSLGIPQAYHSCGHHDGGYDPFSGQENNPIYGPTTLHMQFAPGFATCMNYTGVSEPSCYRYHGDEWLTFEVRIKPGSFWYPDDQVSYHHTGIFQMWYARQGQPFVQIMDRSPSSTFCIDHGGGGTTCGWDFTNVNDTPSGVSLGPGISKYGTVILLPFISYKDPNDAHQTTFTWYDNLIISTSFIPAPTN